MTAWRWEAFFLWPALAGVALCQPPAVIPTANPAAISAKDPAVYIVLKPSVNQPGPARERFLLRMTALGVSNVRFVDSGGMAAVRCTAPVAVTESIAADADVAGVLPIDDSKEPAAPAAPAPSIPAPPTSATLLPLPVPSSPTPALSTVVAPPPMISTPPFIPQQQSFPSNGGIGLGGGSGMNMGIAMLTDVAGGAIVKMLTPAPGCKVNFKGLPPMVPALGGTGAFEVKVAGNCAWQAVSTADWLQVSSSVLGPGAAAVSFTVLPHAAGKRQAAVILQAVGATGPLRGKTVLMVSQE